MEGFSDEQFSNTWSCAFTHSTRRESLVPQISLSSPPPPDLRNRRLVRLFGPGTGMKEVNPAPTGHARGHFIRRDANARPAQADGEIFRDAFTGTHTEQHRSSIDDRQTSDPAV